VAADKEAGGHKKCPNCFVPQVVPEPTYVRVRKKARLRKRPESRVRARVESEGGKGPSEEENAEYFDEDTTEDGRGFVNIRFNESTLFSMSFVFLLLFAADGGMREDLYSFMRRLCGASGLAAGMSIIFLLVPFALGMGLAVFHAFSKKAKTFYEKGLMLFFAVTISGATGIYMGWHMLRGGSLWLIPFAIWNLAYSGLLILKFESIVVLENDCEGPYVSDRDATMGQIVFGSAAAILILLCCGYWLKLHWVITYSICITYTTGIDRQVQRLLGKR
jgi:hypothetical protein